MNKRSKLQDSIFFQIDKQNEEICRNSQKKGFKKYWQAQIRIGLIIICGISRYKIKKIKMHKLSLIAFCFSLTLVLSSHFEASENEKVLYLQSLQKTHQEVKKLVQKLKTYREKIAESLKAVDGYHYLQKNVIESGLERERPIFQQIREKIVLPYDLKTWECRNITKQQIQNVQTKITKLQESEKQLSEVISNQKNCLKINQLKFNLANIKITIKKLKLSLSNNCNPPKVILPQLFMSNLTLLSSGNYLLGEYTPESFQKEKQSLSSQYQVIECPKDKPYALGNHCGLCTFLYNLTSKECLKDGCPTQTYFNKEKKKCLPKEKLVNLEGSENWIFGNENSDTFLRQLKTTEEKQNTESCPKQKPFLNDKNDCFSCENSKVYNISSKQCVLCPQSQQFSAKTHLCQKQEKTTKTIKTTKSHNCPKNLPLWNGTACIKCESPGKFLNNQCKCPEKYKYSQKTYECEIEGELCSDNLFWNGSICIKCEDPGSFNKQTEICECPIDQTYNFHKQECVFGSGVITYVPNLLESWFWIYGENGSQGYDEELNKINSMVTTQECPPDTPYPDSNGKCVTCGKGELFDLTEKKCTSCVSGQYFNGYTHQCSSIIHNETVNCNRPSTYWNGILCISCQNPGKFIKNICECPENYYYDENRQKCYKTSIKMITNFVASKWVYGSIPSNQYDDMLSLYTKKFMLKKCPENKPFASNSGNCINCPQGKVYDLSTGFCFHCVKMDYSTHTCSQREDNEKNVVCPQSLPHFNGIQCIKCEKPGRFNEKTKKCYCPRRYYFNFNEMKCQKNPSQFNTNPNVLNYAGTLPAYSYLKRTCPPHIPFFNGRRCISCRVPKYFDFEKKSCLACGSKFVFDISSKKCIPLHTPKVKFNSLIGGEQNAKNYCCKPPSFDPMIKTCPEKRPFFNNRKCIQCQYPSYFNFTKLECDTCQSGRSFSKIQKKCIEKQYLQAFYTSSITSNTVNYVGEPPQVNSQYQNVIKCPLDNPFYNSQQCLTCALPSYFNFNSLQCENCDLKEKFNTKTKKCELQNLSKQRYNNYLVEVLNFAGKIPNYNPIYATCSASTPYFNGKRCIKCVLPKFFNMDTSVCESCPGKNQIFNILTRQCELSTQKFITNVKTPNIYYNGNYEQLVQFTETKRKQNPSIKDCPSDKPFYQARKGRCISCEGQTPLFDIKYSRCRKCEGHSYFSEEKHICVSNGVIQPSVQRMMMNVFSFL